MRGRKPIPTALHKSRGTLNKTRHVKGRLGEPIASGELDAAPHWLSAAQRDVWDYAVANAPPGLLRTIDFSILLVWVIAFDQHRVAATQMNKMDQGNAFPLLMKRPGLGADNTEIIVSLYLGIVAKAGLRMMKAAAEMGFTPASRPRIGSGKAASGMTIDTDDEDAGWNRLRVLQGGKP